MLTVLRRTLDEMRRNYILLKKAKINCLLARLSSAKKDPSSNPDRATRGGGGF